jgi:hypothetical protein
MFQVGQKVVCINGEYDFAAKVCVPNLPAKGRIYTVRDLTTEGSGPGIRLYELVNPSILHSNYPQPVEPAFHPDRFRPVIERKTDITVFTEMLNKQPSELVG